MTDDSVTPGEIGDVPPSDLTNLRSVTEWLRLGAAANLNARCRIGSIDRIEPPGTLIATGDLHDNPMHLRALLRAANLNTRSPVPAQERRHLVLHELIHGDRLINKMDFSYRTLVQVAELKARFPDHVHVLLGNHELAQYKGTRILKDGVRCLEVFNAGVEYIFGDDAPQVHQAIGEFVTSMPLALRCATSRGDILVAHSMPAPQTRAPFDDSILNRPLHEADYDPRVGSAHLMVWGRGHDAATLQSFLTRFGANMFILGHEKVDEGVRLVEPSTILLNSDHIGGAYVEIDLANPPAPEIIVRDAIKLIDVVTHEES